MPTISEKTYNGVKVEISCNDEGEFSAHVNGEWLRTKTFDTLVNQIKRETKKTKVEVAIPAMLIGVEKRVTEGFRDRITGYTCEPITLLGMDWRNGHPKYRNSKGETKTEGRTGWSLNREAYIGKPMTPEEVEEWVRLQKVKEVAENAFRKFDEKFHFSYNNGIEKLIKKAQADKLDTPDEPETDEDDGDPR